jgi:hypothetical protein
MTEEYKFSKSVALSIWFFLRRRELLIEVTIKIISIFNLEIQNYKLLCAQTIFSL